MTATAMQKVLEHMTDEELRDLAAVYEDQLHQVEGEQARRAAGSATAAAVEDERDVVRPSVGTTTAETLVADCNDVDALARRLAFGA